MKFDSSKYSVNYSPTSIWTNKLGLFDDEKTDKKNKCLSLLRQLNRSANIILNDGENEKNVKVSFSNGDDANTVHKDEIFISPDAFLNSKNEFIVDALTGKVLLATQLKRSVDKKTWKKVQLESKNSDFAPCKNIWQAVEQFIAREEVIKNWEGFVPYFVKHAEDYISEKDKVQNIVNNTFSVEDFSSIFAWNIVYSENPLRVPHQYFDIYDECIKLLDIDKLPADKRWDFSKNIIDIAKKYFEENSGTSSVSCSSSSDQGPADFEEKSSASDHKITDSELFGEKIKNKSLPEAKNIDIEASQEEDYVCRIYENCAKPIEPKFIFKDEIKKNPSLREKYLKKFRKEIQSIKKSLLFRNSDLSIEDYGHENGDIDENSLHKLSYNDYRIYSEKTIRARKNVAICLLVDESGSMMDGNRINSAKEVAFVLSESMKSIDGVKVSVFGHTAQTVEHSNVEITCYKTFEQSDTSGIFEMNAKQQNLDGHAIKYVAKKFANDSNFDKKIMFVISDGEPEGYGYSGESAIKHTGSVCEFCRKKMGVDIIGIGVDSAFSSKVADKLYGKNKSIVLDNVKKSLSVMARYIRQITLKM
jgi:hypothetical protein